jgi:outer membrane protein assembly factor BamE (lipoprotein component of BamABCDE complex)
MLDIGNIKAQRIRRFSQTGNMWEMSSNFDSQKSITGDVMINFSRIAVVLLSMILLSACGSVKVGRDFDVGVFAAKIEQGVTSQEQVRSWLGEPTSVGVSVAADGERSDEWSYYFAEGELSDMSTAKVKILQIKFDKLGKVRSYNWSASKQ